MAAPGRSGRRSSSRRVRRPRSASGRHGPGRHREWKPRGREFRKRRAVRATPGWRRSAQGTVFFSFSWFGRAAGVTQSASLNPFPLPCSYDSRVAAAEPLVPHFSHTETEAFRKGAKTRGLTDVSTRRCDDTVFGEGCARLGTHSFSSQVFAERLPTSTHIVPLLSFGLYQTRLRWNCGTETSCFEHAHFSEWPAAS